MYKSRADFYVKVNEHYTVVEIVGRSYITSPANQLDPGKTSGIKWYKDTYKSEYKGVQHESNNQSNDDSNG